ncbi:phosphate-starvation-inducible PsiE family protein [Thiothrix litoralis]|uniref:Phosphate-starvation-inducible PsiE family protein n=1 Tax=Thiothrix litoralis TaxID=2891210 RepID=A0ABX7WVX4_9GAMM|nr:phosphate-starvation-inducible PsiE family protein [Thiothrix litoralis]QTR47839.1 phosphate-starvation-inducible PsiE family protein [Thiothrix litoralis]
MFVVLMKNFEKFITLALIVMMLIVVALSTMELGWLLYKDVFNPPLFVLDTAELLEIFGFFLMILIGLELLETMKEYYLHGKIGLHVIIAIALIALGRKIITLDIDKYQPLALIGVGVIIASLVGGYWVIKCADSSK